MSIGQIAAYDQYKAFLGNFPEIFPETSIFTHFTASLLSGITATTITQPLDVMKTRMMANKGEYKSILHCASEIFRENRFFGFFKGNCRSDSDRLQSIAIGYISQTGSGRLNSVPFARRQKSTAPETFLVPVAVFVTNVYECFVTKPFALAIRAIMLNVHLEIRFALITFALLWSFVMQPNDRSLICFSPLQALCRRS